ncbi:MAG TPA: multicopper oxidase family protein [Longimicrobiaceae bacterium]|nr:multicopper oxidase family protein [Longimicrobiaceae bacterium]
MRPIHAFRAAACAAALLGAVPHAAAQQAPVQWTRYTPPPVVSSDSATKTLTTTLTAIPGQVTVAGATYQSNLLNGLITPPVLDLEPGDSLNLLLVNAMPAAEDNWTNLHFHGFAVSPLPPADNVTMIHVLPGSSYQFQMRLPDDHPEGLFWYHPHPHGVSDPQVAGGMSGVINIGNPRRHFGPAVQAAPEFFLMLKAYAPEGVDEPMHLVNGQPRVELPELQQGQAQFWRIANISSGTFYRLRVRDPQGKNVKFQVIARDGNVVRRRGGALPIVEEDSMLLGPGQRFEILVKLDTPGEHLLVSDPQVQTHFHDDTLYLARVYVVPAPPARRAPTLAERSGGDPREEALIARLLAADSVIRQTVTFDVAFRVDGASYDPNVIMRELRVGQVYEWTIENLAVIWHIFHIHQGDLVVLSMDGERFTPNYRVDTANLPPRSRTVIRFLYERPATAGPFVYHCHILGHEDLGMMANVLLLGAAEDGNGTAARSSPAPAHRH